MANEKTLIKFTSEQSREEARKNGRKGGIKSGEVRRARKSFKDSFVDELSKGKSQQEIVKAVLEKAMQGDIQSAIFIRDTIGEKPTDKVENSGTQTLDINIKVME